MISSTSTTTPNITYPSTALGITTDLKWNQKELKTLALAKVGFKYNKKISCWELDLTATISVPQSEGILEYVGPYNNRLACDKAIKSIKELKERLIKKLTAKMILIELSKPREIKEQT